MKFIKSKKLFESNISIETEVQDILKEINDLGHDLHIQVFNFKDHDRIDIFINFLNKFGNQTETDISVWFDLFSHLFSYLESEDWHLHSTYVINDEKIGQDEKTDFYRSVITNLDLTEDSKMCKRLEIRFDKFK